MKKVDGVAEKRGFVSTIRSHGVVLFFCMVSLPLLILLLSRQGITSSSFDWILRLGAGSRQDSGDPLRNKVLGNLLSTAFKNEKSCRSRYEIASYWKASNHLPSHYLVQKLKAYEALHKRCGPNTELYRRSIEQLKSNKSTSHSECSYVVYYPSDGLGNRIISLISTFLYALLSNKVLLLDLPGDLQGIFCEPFPDSSWILPWKNFPLEGYQYINTTIAPESFGNLVRNMEHAENASVPGFALIHVKHDSDEFDSRFFCDESQLLLQRIPWLLLRSNQYFAPGLFLVSQYAEELDMMFPEKDTVFHHLARYLLHPTDLVWGYITRYYEAYLSDGDERIGVQTRVLVETYDVKQVINCLIAEKLLPKIVVKEPISRTSKGKKKVVLVTSLKLDFFEKLRDMFYEHPTIDGGLIRVYQPSHEEEQHSDRQNHNVKALSEMYLLSFSDVLVTSSWSTFGYVAQGLGGLKPWILLGNDGPACSRAMSMEPCFHFPMAHKCKKHKYDDKGAVVPHVRHCEDVLGGIKLIDQAWQ